MHITELNPVAGYALVRKEEPKRETNSGILYTEKTKIGDLLQGEIVRINHKEEWNKDMLKEGVRILFKKYHNPLEVVVNDETLVVIEIVDIYAVIKND